jgi:hypothetical protein
MGFVRAFRKEDIPEVVALWQRAHRVRELRSPESVLAYFEEIFFQNPWYDQDLPSLVYEHQDGHIIAFLGVVPRRMEMKGRALRVAVSTQLITDPLRTCGFAAIELTSAFFAGPQDLAYTDGATDATQRVWELCGGDAARLYCLDWTRVLRPAQHLKELLRSRRMLAPILWAAKPLCHMLDSLLSWAPLGPFRVAAPTAPAENLDDETLLWCLSHFSRRQALRPTYDQNGLKWLSGQIEKRTKHGQIRRIVVRDRNGEIVGWYIYYVRKGAVAQVLQFGGQKEAISQVLNHLFYDARQHGAVAVSGQMNPHFVRELSDSHCKFACLSLGVLVRSRDQEILRAFHAGRSYFTRLEGEWWLRFSDIRHDSDKLPVEAPPRTSGTGRRTMASMPTPRPAKTQAAT